MLLKIQNQVVLLDDDVYNALPSKRIEIYTSTRSCLSYVYVYLPQRKLLHRHIMGLLSGDARIVDHINRNPLDNRRENLRVCSHAENLRNRGRCIASTGSKYVTTYKGISFNRENLKWKAYTRFKIKGKSVKVHLHTGTKEECAFAYNVGVKLASPNVHYLNEVTLSESVAEVLTAQIQNKITKICSPC